MLKSSADVEHLGLLPVESSFLFGPVVRPFVYEPSIPFGPVTA